MNKALSATTVLIVAALFAAASADEATPPKTVEVASLDRAKSLAPGTTSVSIHYTSEMHSADEFTSIMSTLARNPGIRHLTLRIPNAKHVYGKHEAFDVLREFQSLETLELLDARDWKAPSVFEQVAGIKDLKRVKFSFL